MAIEIVVSGEYTGGRAFDQANKDIGSIGEASDTANNRVGGLFSTLGGVALGAAAAGAVALGGALIGVGAAAVDFAGQSNQALNDLQAQFGVTEEHAESLGDVAKTVFANNFGDSIGEATQAVALVEQQLGDLGVVSDDALADVAESAFAIRDAFGIEINESIGVTETLMKEFGLTSQQSMDLFVAANQRGLNASDDLLDTIQEYGPQLAANGLSAEAFFNLLDTGSKSGVMGTDKIGDAFKELFIILNEGGEDANAALASIGLSLEDMQTEVASGRATWGDYTQQIITGLQGIEDPIKRGQAEVALFGTMAEDIGTGFTDGLSTAQTALADLSGATDSLNVQYENFGSVFETFKRQALVALEPLGQELLNLASAIMPSVIAAFAWFNEQLPRWIDAGRTAFAALQPVIETIGRVVQQFGNDHQEEWDAIQETVTTITATVSEIITTVFGAIQAFFQTHGDTINRIFRFAFDSIVNQIRLSLDILRGITTTVLALLKGDWEGAGQGIQQIVNGLVRFVTEQFNNLKQLVIDLGPGFLQAAKGIGQAIVDGITGAISAGARWIADAARNAANAALNAAKTALGIRSPSSLFEQVGRDSIGGWVNGILAGQGTLASAVADLARSVAQQAASAMLSGITSSLRNRPTAQDYRAGAESVLNQISVTINQTPGERGDQVANRALEGLLRGVQSRG